MLKRLGLLLLLCGCSTYPEPTRYDLACAAAADAFRDAEVKISLEDCAKGQIRGSKDGTDVTANLRTQVDGSVRVEFRTGGKPNQALIHRVSEAYDKRMGR